MTKRFVCCAEQAAQNTEQHNMEESTRAHFHSRYSRVYGLINGREGEMKIIGKYIQLYWVIKYSSLGLDAKYKSCI